MNGVFEDFLNGLDPLTTDCSAAVTEAAIWSAANNKTIAFTGRYLISNAATITTSGARFHFSNCRFDISDSGTSGTLTNGEVGKVGFLFKNADNLQISGSARLIGLGVIGDGTGTVGTTLAGMAFDNCDYANITADLYFQTMAAGLYLSHCNFGMFGNITAYQMNGRQTFDTGTAGTALVVTSCYECTFGDTTSYANYKPVVYLSVDGTGTDNENCRFGFILGHATTGSTESSLIALRSAINCSFAGCSGDGFSAGTIFLNYSGDENYRVDGNNIEVVRGNFPSTEASANCAVITQAGASVPIGRNRIGSVDAVCAGEHGVIVTSGVLEFGSIRIDGSGRPIVVQNGELIGDTLVVKNQGLEPVTLGLGSYLSVRHIEILTGSIGGATIGIRYRTDFGTGGTGLLGCNVEHIFYRRNSTGMEIAFLIFDNVNGPNLYSIGHCDTTVQHSRLAVHPYYFRHGLTYTDAAPTGGTFAAGHIVYNLAPTASGKIGWVCVTAGTPGTWKTWGAIDA